MGILPGACPGRPSRPHGIANLHRSRGTVHGEARSQNQLGHSRLPKRGLQELKLQTVVRLGEVNRNRSCTLARGTAQAESGSQDGRLELCFLPIADEHVSGGFEATV